MPITRSETKRERARTLSLSCGNLSVRPDILRPLGLEPGMMTYVFACDLSDAKRGFSPS
jgi:hypothetical protein